MWLLLNRNRYEFFPVEKINIKQINKWKMQCWKRAVHLLNLLLNYSCIDYSQNSNKRVKNSS